MKELFYIGLSWIPSVHPRTGLREKQSAEARRILSFLDNNNYSENNYSSNNYFTHKTGGRPFFSDKHADFSISHSKNMAAVSLVSSGARTGCDIQYVHPRKSYMEISRRFFHISEQAYVENGGINQLVNFYRIWVLKESWLKLNGFSVFKMSGAPVFIIGTAGTETDAAGQPEFFLYELFSPQQNQLYMLAIARQRIYHTSENLNYFSGCSASCFSESGSRFVSEPEFRWLSEPLELKRLENIYAAQSPEKTVTPKM